MDPSAHATRTPVPLEHDRPLEEPAANDVSRGGCRRSVRHEGHRRMTAAQEPGPPRYPIACAVRRGGFSSRPSPNVRCSQTPRTAEARHAERRR